MKNNWLNYPEMIASVLRNGRDRDSRLGPTKEIVGFNVQLPVGQLFYRPKMLRKLGWLEGLHVLAGVFIESDYARIAPNLQWAYTIDAAYGPKLLEQLYDINAQLKKDPSSRRAIAFIGGREYSGERAKPCINSYQFLVADGKLHMILSARSWDLISGFLYDTMVAGMVGIAMALSLNLDPGTIYAQAGSAHIYMADVKSGRSPHEIKTNSYKIMLPRSAYAGRDWEFYRQIAFEDLHKLRNADKDAEFCPSFVMIQKGLINDDPGLY